MKILLHFRTFPIAMGRYIEWALKDLGHKVLTVGPNIGDEVPWPGGPWKFPKYNFGADLVLPDVESLAINNVIRKIKGIPDVIIQCGDTVWLKGKPKYKIKNIIVATDPHCIDYNPRLKNADEFWCMQDHYLKERYWGKGRWFPYAYLPAVHKRFNQKVRYYDIVFSGLMYDNRDKFLTEMTARGYKVWSGLGKLYREYAELYNNGIIAFNWSSRMDLPARFWEGLAMGNLVFTNRVPDLRRLDDDFGIKEDVHYVCFDSVEEAIDKAEWYLRHPIETARIMEAGYQKVQPHTYQNRLEELLCEIQH